MIGIFKGNFISQRHVKGQKGDYYYALFNDGEMNFEVQTKSPIGASRFEEYKLLVDVIQGKYPRFLLLELEEVNEK